MRILHVDTGRELRGGQHQVLLTIEGLRQAGHECALAARRNSPLWKQADLAASAAGIWKSSSAFDLVHAHDARAHSICALACRLPFVVSRRVAFPIRRSFDSQWKYRRARRYLAVSRFVAGELQRAGVPQESIDVVYDGVNHMQAPAVWDAASPAIALASWDPQKGRALVTRAAQTAGVPVIFSTDLNQDFKKASMFVYITQSEGLGSAALFAMARGVPVIASRVGGLSEVFEHGLSGLYVSNEIEEIASAMKTIRENPALATTLIEGGKQRVADMFTARHLIEGTLKSYERALAR